MKLDEYKFNYCCITKHSKEEKLLREMKTKVVNLLSTSIYYHGIYLGCFQFFSSELDKTGEWRFEPYYEHSNDTLVVSGAYNIEYAWAAAKEIIDNIVEEERKRHDIRGSSPGAYS